MPKLGMLKSVDSRAGTRSSNSVSLTVKDIPIGDIQIKENVRKDYTAIEELAESIKRHGLLQPITVYPDGDIYIVKTGHRRFKAYSLLFQQDPEHYHSIRCIISDDGNIAIVQLVENVQRQDLSQIELANALTALRQQGLTHKQIADFMGKSEGYIKILFMGVNEINTNSGIRELLEKSYAGITIQDVVETRGIEDPAIRSQILDARQQGTMNRAQMREAVKEINADTPAVKSVPDAITQPVPTEPSVKITVSPNGLTIKLVFNNENSAKTLETGIRRLLARHQVKVVETY
jgi:ParB family chromosome partitioning protein